MRTQLKKGSWIKIYSDPLTMKQPEGEAQLKKQISYDHWIERWYVKFRGDSEMVIRAIHPVNEPTTKS